MLPAASFYAAHGPPDVFCIFSKNCVKIKQYKEIYFSDISLRNYVSLVLDRCLLVGLLVMIITGNVYF